MFFIQAEITDFKEKLQLAKETINRFKAEIAKVQKERGVDSSAGSVMFGSN
jgi:hypothetical protein